MSKSIKELVGEMDGLMKAARGMMGALMEKQAKEPSRERHIHTLKLMELIVELDRVTRIIRAYQDHELTKEAEEATRAVTEITKGIREAMETAQQLVDRKLH